MQRRANEAQIAGRALRGSRGSDRLSGVIGAEGKGLRRPVKAACARLVRLPMKGPLGSLNASVAAAIALYEAMRQRANRSRKME